MKPDQRADEPARAELAQEGGRAVLRLAGDWTVFTMGEGRQALASAGDGKGAAAAIDIAAIDTLDTAGAMAIVELARRVGEPDAPCPIDGARDNHARLLELVARQKIAPEPRQRRSRLEYWLAVVGEETVKLVRQGRDLLAFLGEVLVVALSVLLNPRRMRPIAVANLMEQVWMRALPIVGTLVFLIGVVLAYQGVQQLERFGAQTFTVNMVGISILRELGVLLTAIIVAGRSGSAFTAQIGTMKVNLEVDAMTTFGLNPIEVLVLPRIVALVVTMPLLVFFANMMGLLGGALACSIFLDFTLVQYFRALREVFDMSDFIVGMVKAPVFAAVIAVVGCYEGLQVTGSAESVGKQTTRSVVESIFLVIILDAAFSIVFASLGI